MTTVIESVVKLSNGKFLNITSEDARTVTINTSSIAFLEVKKNDDNEITSISFEGKFTIKQGDHIKVKVGELDSIYVAKHIIVSDNEKRVTIISSNRSKTTVFLLPSLGKSKKLLRFSSYFVNAFLSEDLQHLHLLYRFTGTSIYKDFEQYMMTDPLCVKHIEYDPYHVVYVFKIPNRFEEDIKHFIDGKYSKLSKDLRQRIVKFYGSESSNVMKIIRKNAELKYNIETDLGISLPADAELASKPDLNFEIHKV